MSLHDDLKWRYATKAMNGEKVTQDKVDYILEAARLAASSSGLQPYKIFVISDQKILEGIKPIAYGQSQITDCSHLLVFAAWDNYTEERIRAVFKRSNEERGIPDAEIADYVNGVVQSLTSNSAEVNFAYTARQAYIGLGTALAAAAELRVDSTPMEGFNNAELDKFLQLPEQGLKSTCMMALGYRDESKDWLVNMKKVRTPKNEFIVEMS